MIGPPFSFYNLFREKVYRMVGRKFASNNIWMKLTYLPFSSFKNKDCLENSTKCLTGGLENPTVYVGFQVASGNWLEVYQKLEPALAVLLPRDCWSRLDIIG